MSFSRTYVTIFYHNLWAVIYRINLQNKFSDVTDWIYVYWLARDRRLVNKIIKCMQKLWNKYHNIYQLMFLPLTSRKSFNRNAIDRED